MPWPIDDLSTNLFDSQSDSPSQGLSMLHRLLQRVKSIIAARGQANGVCDLDAAGRVPGARLGRGVANGLATLGSNGKVVSGQLDGVLMTQAERTKLGGIEAGARADQTGAEIQAALDARLGAGWRTPSSVVDTGITSVVVGPSRREGRDLPGELENFLELQASITGRTLTLTLVTVHDTTTSGH